MAQIFRNRSLSVFPKVPQKSLVVLCLALCLIFDAAAQVPTPADINNANRAAEQIQREQQERLQQQLQRDAQRSRESKLQAEPEARLPNLPKSTVCREIREIVFNGVTLLSHRVTDQLAAPFVGKCLYAEDIEKLLGNLLKEYIDRGYIGVRPYIQAQDLSSGRLEILIVEGRVKGLLLKGGEQHGINLAMAFPFIEGKPLNLRDIEQGLDQLNRLTSNNATMEILPGAEAGESVVSIANTSSLPFAASVAANNLGGPSTGEYQASYTASMDSPLGLSDFITYTHTQSLFEDDRNRDSVSDSFFYSLPIGYWTLQLSSNASSYHTPVVTSTRTLVASGNSENQRAELAWVAYRDRDQKLGTLLAITKKTTRSYLDGEMLSVSSRNLTLLDVGANWSRRFAGFSANLNVGWSKGLRWFDALEDASGLDSAAPHAQGSKLVYGGGVQIPFVMLEREFSFSSQLTGQYAFQPLYGSEQITIGSYYSVRGFNRYSVAGDRGYFVRNELSTVLPGGAFLALTPRAFVACDAGHLDSFKESKAADLSGAAVGLRFAGKHLVAEISVAKALTVPESIKRESARFSASLVASF